MNEVFAIACGGQMMRPSSIFSDGGLVKISNTSVTSDGKQNSFFQYYSIEGTRDYSVKCIYITCSIYLL